MAAIKQRKTKYSVIYWYVNEQGERKQKWDTVDTIGEAKSRKVFVEFYQEKYGQTIVPNEKAKRGKKAEPMSTIAARSRFAEEPRPQKAR